VDGRTEERQELLAVHGEREGLLANDLAGDLVAVTAADPDVRTHGSPAILARIQDPDQREPARRRRWARARTVARLAHGAEPGGVPRAAPNRDRTAHDVAGHVVEVAVRRQQHREPLLPAG